MGMLIDGHWNDTDRVVVAGRYIRPKSRFSEALDESVVEQLRREPGRYHLIASPSCPWSHRTLIVRALKGLSNYVPVQIAGGPRIEGYAVDGGARWAVPGTAFRIRHVHELYSLTDGAYTGRATVPVLWDSYTRRIASNESGRIMRAFDAAGMSEFTLAPAHLRREIDDFNAHLHDHLSDAVYRAGFAQREDAHNEAVEEVFATLQALDHRLEGQRYLFGTTITESDWRLFPTLARFDAVYYSQFQCSRRRLVDFPHLWAYARDLFAWRGVADTVDLAAIYDGYRHDPTFGPGGADVPPPVDWTAPHGRQRLGPAKCFSESGREIAVDPATLAPLSGNCP